MTSQLSWGRPAWAGSGATRRWTFGRNCRTSRGFTLIEVLVVVAIIALLVSILLPALQRARQQARKIVCGTNMRTCHQAMTLYLHSNADYFPWNAKLRDPSKPDGPVWGANPWEIFYKCVQKGTPAKLTQLEKCPLAQPNQFHGILDWYVCPSDLYYHTTSQDSQYTFPDGSQDTIEFMLSYCVAASTCYIFRPGTTGGAQDNACASWKSTAIRRQSDMVLFGEFGDDNTRMGGKFAGVAEFIGQWELSDHNVPGYSSGSTVGNQTEHFQLQHLGGCNVMYLDGHYGFSRLNWSDTLNYGLPPYPSAFIANWTKTDADGQPVDENNDKGRPEPVP